MELLPGVNCGRCGYPGCGGAADALVAGTAAPTLCPPGGAALARTLAAKLGRALDASGGPPLLAEIDESLCIGCAHCGKLCATDAIIGAPSRFMSFCRKRVRAVACVSRCARPSACNCVPKTDFR